MNIFLSRPTWIPPEFTSGVNTFLTQLQNLGLTPRTLGVSDYPSKAPLDEVIDILKECRGAIILGVPQIEISTGLLKGSSIEPPITLATEWNHLEAGLAYAAGIPILIIHHHSITRGIFDRGVLNAFLHSVDLSESNWSMQSHLNGAITKWKERCAQGGSNFQKSAQSSIEVAHKKISNDSPGNFPSIETQAVTPVAEGISARTFKEITNAIESMPPLQRDVVAKGYKGLQVKWQAYFKGGSNLENGLMSIRFKPEPTSWGCSIICKISENEYPQLKTLHEGEKVEIIGEIEEADRFDIRLKNVRISFN